MASIPGALIHITGASGSQGLLAPSASWRAYVFPRGGYAAQDSTGTLITFDSAAVASRFATSNWIQVGLSIDNIRQVSAVGGNSISVSGAALTVSENNRVYLIGNTQPSTAGGSATYTTPASVIRQRDDDGSDIFTNSMVTSNADGLVQFFSEPSLYDVLIQDGNRTNQGSIIDLPVGAVEGISTSFASVFGATVTFLAGVSMNTTLIVGQTITLTGTSGNYNHAGMATFGTTVTIPGAIGSTGTVVASQFDLRTTGFVNVKSWGALGDSSTNDTAGISLAMTYAYGNSLAGLFFPPGVYLASRITWKSGMRLIGSGTNTDPNGRGTTLQQISGSNQDFIVTDTALGSTAFMHQSAIENMTIRGNTTDTSGSGIRFNSRWGENTVIERCTVRNFRHSGIRASFGGAPLYVNQVQATNNESFGILIDRSGSDVNHTCLLNMISGDDNGTALIGISTSGAVPGSETYVLNAIKAEKATAGRQNYAVLLNNMGGSPVVVNGLACSNPSGETMTAAIGITNGTCRLTWNAVNAATSNYLVEDLVNGVTYTGTQSTSGVLATGTYHAWRFAAAAQTNQTIAGGSISITGTNHRVDTEAAAASDDLDTILGGIPGQFLILRAVNGARTVVIKHATGNIQVSGAADFSLDNANDTALLFFDGTNWLSLSNASNGA